MKLCVTNDFGKPVAFFDSNVHAPEKIPAEAFEISDEDWQECIDHPRARYFEGGDLVECAQHDPNRMTTEEMVKRRIDGDPVLGALLDVLHERTGAERHEIESAVIARIEAE